MRNWIVLFLLLTAPAAGEDVAIEPYRKCLMVQILKLDDLVTSAQIIADVAIMGCEKERIQQAREWLTERNITEEDLKEAVANTRPTAVRVATSWVLQMRAWASSNRP